MKELEKDLTKEQIEILKLLANEKLKQIEKNKIPKGPEPRKLDWWNL